MADRIDSYMPSRESRPWTHEERVCLYMLWTEHPASNIERTAIFNEVFRGRLKATRHEPQAFNDDVIARSQKSLEAEYCKRPGAGKKASPAWNLVCSPPQTAREAMTRTQIRARIANIVDRRGGRGRYLQFPRKTPSQQLTPPTTPSALGYSDNEQALRLTKRKQSITYVDDDVFNDDEYFASIMTATRPRQSSPVVLIPSTPRMSTTDELSTPNIAVRTSMNQRASAQSTRTRTASGRQLEERMTYTRMGNTPTSLPRHRYLWAPQTSKGYIDVPEEEGHPWLPAALFRFYDDHSRGINSTSGFKSGRTAFARAPPRKAPLCKDLEWTDVLEHLNPSHHLDHPQPSPFISTSHRLIWTIQQGLRKLGPAGRVSVIDPSAIDSRAIYYVPPFHEQLHNHFVFDRGAQYWKGLSEHLVWDEVPESAMVKTFTIGELCEFADSDPTLKRVLRLDTLRSDSKLARTISAFKKDKVQITNQVACAIAEMAMFFGIGHTSSVNIISYIACEIADGWALFPEGNFSESEWQERARWFTHTLCRQSDEPVSLARQAEISQAFLDGFKWSRGDRGNLNTRYEKLNVLKMQKRAAKIGLADPLQIVTSELNAAAGIVQRRDADQRRRLSLWRTTLPASNDDQNDDQEDTENNLQVQAEEEIDTKHESDDDGDDDGMIHEDSDGDHADVYYEQDGLRSAVNPKAGTRCVIWMSMDEAI